nr:hypothetical protein [uncultured Agrobacterium sp.]
MDDANWAIPGRLSVDVVPANPLAAKPMESHVLKPKCVMGKHLRAVSGQSRETVHCGIKARVTEKGNTRMPHEVCATNAAANSVS